MTHLFCNLHHLHIQKSHVISWETHMKSDDWDDEKKKNKIGRDADRKVDLHHWHRQRSDKSKSRFPVTSHDFKSMTSSLLAHLSSLIWRAKSPKTLATANVPPPAIVPSNTATNEPGYASNEASTSMTSLMMKWGVWRSETDL